MIKTSKISLDKITKPVNKACQLKSYFFKTVQNEKTMLEM